jgi:arabinose-5-phosphate isomerase
LKKTPGAAWVAVTAGNKGAWLSDGKQTVKQAAFKVKALDTTGCGDAFHGALIAARSIGMAPAPALRLACAAGAVAATQVGAVPSHVARPAILKLFGQPWPLPEMPRLTQAQGEGSQYLRVAQSELQAWAGSFNQSALEQAKQLVLSTEANGGRLHVTGVGKCEYVAGYVASSYSSTGTPAFFLHATEAGHGASGQVHTKDLVIAISNSGETDELKAAVNTLKKNGAKILGVSGRPQSWLARHSDAFLWAGVRREGDDLNLAPRNSVLVEVLVLNALGVALQHEKKFSAEQFRAFHPGGSLGKVAE